VDNKSENSKASIPANIAEGYGRRSTAEYIGFINRSVNELQTHIILSERVRLSEQKHIEQIISLLREESRMIIPLIKN
jgi:four helix bundle protein